MNYIIIPENKKEKLEQFIRGSILGDGSIPKLRGKNCHMSFGHSEKQLDYLNWKRDFLHEYGLANEISKYIHNSTRYKSGSCVTFHLHSKVNPIFTEFRNLYYSEKKFLNREDFIRIDEFALAIWYMDDGNIWNIKNKSSKITLNTQSFSIEDVKFMANFLSEKWNLACSYNKSDNTIIINVVSCDRFISLVKPYIVKCMEYKMVLFKSDELLEALREVGNQQPSLIRAYISSKKVQRLRGEKVHQ